MVVGIVDLTDNRLEELNPLLYETSAVLLANAYFKTPSPHNAMSTPYAGINSPPASGDFWNTRGIKSFIITIFADQVSATGGIKVIGSGNGSTDHQILISDTLSSSTGYSVIVNTPWDYTRFEFQNGGTNQTSFVCRVRGIPYGVTTR